MLAILNFDGLVVCDKLKLLPLTPRQVVIGRYTSLLLDLKAGHMIRIEFDLSLVVFAQLDKNVNNGRSGYGIHCVPFLVFFRRMCAAPAGERQLSSEPHWRLPLLLSMRSSAAVFTMLVFGFL